MTSLSGSRSPQLTLGQHVVVDMGTHSERGVLVEDRGLLGVDGGRIWRVRIAGGDREQREVEAPEGRLQALKSNATLRSIPLRNGDEVTASGRDVDLLLTEKEIDKLYRHDWSAPITIAGHIVSAPANVLARSYPALEVGGSLFVDVEVLDPSAASGGMAPVAAGGRVKLRIRQEHSRY